jgi:hypothetical protein
VPVSYCRRCLSVPFDCEVTVRAGTPPRLATYRPEPLRVPVEPEVPVVAAIEPRDPRLAWLAARAREAAVGAILGLLLGVATGLLAWALL